MEQTGPLSSPWIAQLRNRTGNRYASINKIAQSIQQRTLGSGRTVIPMPTILEWLRENEDRAGDFRGLQTSALVSLIEQDMVEDSQATTLGAAEEVAELPPPAPGGMAGYIEELPDTDAEVSFDEEESFQPGQNWDDLESDLDQAIVDVMSQEMGSPELSFPLPQGMVAAESEDEDEPAPTQSVPPSVSPSIAPSAAPSAAPAISIVNQPASKPAVVADKVLAGILENKNATAMAKALGYDLKSAMGIQAFQRYLIQRAQFVLMRRTPSGKPRAKPSTARPRMYFNRDGPSRLIRYT